MGYEKPKDYNEVQDRIVEFREKYPDGSLQSDPPEWVRDGKGDLVGVTLRALAFRTPDDARPGHGTAYEVFPGKTPYTKGSEVMNAETSAWGRALIAVGAADAKKGIASANEVRNAQAANAAQKSEPVKKSGPAPKHVQLQTQAIEVCKTKGISQVDALSEFHSIGGIGKISECEDVILLAQFVDHLEGA